MEHHPAPRQSQSYLRQLFLQGNLRPKNKLGQNFLIDHNLLDFIVRSAELTRADLVLEVGTGTGNLTSRLADLAGAVLTVEIDPSFHELARDLVGARDNVRMLLADVLKNKNHLNPEVLAHLEELRQIYRPQQIKLVANLPYAVATPVLSNLLLEGVALERMVATVQWEIAEKLVARPGTRDYGALAVMMQSVADVEVLRRVPSAVFWPRPQVESGIVRIRANADKRRQIPDVLRYRHFLRDLYAHRRKNLRGGLIAMTGHQHDKSVVDRKLAELGYTGTERAETLTIAQHQQLCEAFRPETAAPEADMPEADMPENATARRQE